MERFEPTSKVLDVVIATNNLFLQGNTSNASLKPFPGKIETLAEGITIGRLSHDLCNKIMDACDPASYPKQAERGWDQIYCFVRELPDTVADEHRHDLKWDIDNKLQECVALSRLVRPNPASFKYAARIFRDENNDVKSIVPGPINGPGAHVYVAEPTKQSWLDQNDLIQLKRLWCSWLSLKLPVRIRRAFWLHEYIARTYELNARWAMVVTALESLINTEREQITKQFIKRVPELAKLCKLPKLSSKEINEVYELRSQFIHSGGIDVFIPATGDAEKQRLIELYARIEEILRVVLMQSIINPEMTNKFADKESVENAFPIKISLWKRLLSYWL